MGLSPVASGSGRKVEDTGMKHMRTESCLVLCLFSVLASAHGASGQLTVTVNPSDYEITSCDGFSSVSMEGFSDLSVSGMPVLPRKTYLFLLPPGARATSAEAVALSSMDISGEYRITPGSGVFILPSPEDGAIAEYNRALGEERLNRIELASASKVPYPERNVWLSGAGTLGEYSYAAVSFCPFTYLADTGTLTLHSNVTVRVNYDINSEESGSLSSFTLNDNLERARELFQNFNDFSGEYSSGLSSGSDETFDYVIVTAAGLQTALDSSLFPEWKETLGFSVRTVLVTDPEIAGQPGSDLPARIRNFLREYRSVWGIEYVLFIGDYETVPMKICYPDPNYHVYDPSNPGLVAPGTPTDAYYADLSYPDSLSWDLDGDGYFGEYGQDMPDFLAEVYVGRIPVNNAGEILQVLNKTVLFEQDTGSWKNNVLQAGTILFFENQNYSGSPLLDGAVLLDSMETGLMTGMTITHMSEQFGLQKSFFPWSPVSEAAFSNSWRSNQYSVVNWSGHGWPNGAARSVWAWDDGDGVPESSTGEFYSLYFINVETTVLEDDHPSVVFAVSCDVGYPEPNAWGNCGIDLLTESGWGSSVGVVSASRPAAVSGDWKNEPGGTEQICFDFNRYLIYEGERVGDALYKGKFDANSVYGWELVYEYMNLYNYNLYGDPSLEISGITSGTGETGDGEQEAPGMILSGPNPFSSSTSVSISLPWSAVLDLAVFDLAGRRVATIADGIYPAGEYEFVWNGTSESGHLLETGTYFAVCRSGGIDLTGKIILLR